MTNEEKDLALKDFCARLPYWINVLTKDNDKGHIIGVDDTENGVFVVHIIEDGDSYTCDKSIEDFKPYLRSMSSMTEEEKKEAISLGISRAISGNKKIFDGFGNVGAERQIKGLDWLNSHYFDYRGLIEKGLALEAPKDMYKF